MQYISSSKSYLSSEEISTSDGHLSENHSSRITREITTIEREDLSIGWRNSTILSSIMTSIEDESFPTLPPTKPFVSTSDDMLTQDTMNNDTSTTFYYSTTMGVDNGKSRTKMVIIISGSVGGTVGLFLITLGVCVLYKYILPKCCRKRTPIVRSQHEYIDLDPIGLSNKGAFSMSLETIEEEEEESVL